MLTERDAGPGPGDAGGPGPATLMHLDPQLQSQLQYMASVAKQHMQMGKSRRTWPIYALSIMNYAFLSNTMYRANSHIFPPKGSTAVINEKIVAYGQKVW